MRRLGGWIFAMAVATAAPVGVSGQSCMALPVGSGEVWVGLGRSSVAEGVLYEGSASLNAAGRVAARFSVGHGAHDVPGGRALVSGRVGGIAYVGPVMTCAWGYAGHLEYSFKNRGGMFRGEVFDRVLGFGVQVAGRLVNRRPFQLDWSAAAGLSNQRHEINGRRLVVIDVDIYEQGVREVSYEWPRMIAVGLTARLWRFGLGVYLADRPAITNGVTLGAEVGLMAIRLAN